MTKAQLCRMAAKASGYSVADCDRVGRKLFGSPMLGTEIGLIADLIFQGRTIEIRGFGTFYPASRKPRPGRDFFRGISVMIPGFEDVVFVASPTIKIEEAPCEKTA